jgi:hypothetical protein
MSVAIMHETTRICDNMDLGQTGAQIEPFNSLMYINKYVSGFCFGPPPDLFDITKQRESKVRGRAQMYNPAGAINLKCGRTTK